jgi:calcineurin-like phosphoesterase family protein
MPAVYLVSDTHFGHANDGVTKLRPWDNPEEMDEFMIAEYDGAESIELKADTRWLIA